MIDTTEAQCAVRRRRVVAAVTVRAIEDRARACRALSLITGELVVAA